MSKQLLKFRLKYLWLNKQQNIVFLILAIYVMLFGEFNWQEDLAIKVSLISIIIYQIYNIQNWFKDNLII